ncbi:winged helix-turn-helix transcriptional regulator [bacterium 1XD8-76]|nr:winged helix-turn-helix transcriptional regulator [bacterium 1XD8-76]
MNKQELDILLSLSSGVYDSQRALAERTGYSLGLINRSVKNLVKCGYLDEKMCLTGLSREKLSAGRPRNAIILAAGFGVRMVPINMETPKALLEVRGEKLIERLIKQLREAGIKEIYVVVGFKKESFEYLIDDFGVKLIVNPDYAAKNNLYSLYLASRHISNTYILPCDLWCEENLFRRQELYSWYMVSDRAEEGSGVRVNRKMELVRTQAELPGNAMIGISYILEKDAEEIRDRINEYCSGRRYEDAYWEEVLYQNGRMTVYPRVITSSGIVEINTYEQLRELDSSSEQLRSDAITIAAEALCVKEEDITGISVLKKGMTNRSFSFCCGGKKYIMRIPGEGTEQLINRREEAEVYREIREQNICDEVIYIDAENGYKITEYIQGARVCDPCAESDIRKCMEKLRNFHALKLVTAHEFDIWKQIEFYESLWEGESSSYRDYFQTKESVLSLRPFTEKYAAQKVLTHIDAVPDNFLFVVDENGKESIRMIDWEYAGMQDPHIDIAMFCIYSFYERAQVDHLIDLYFAEGCEKTLRIKIYCYIAACGLLWSNWCEYKRKLGVEFGEYSLRQYRYAKEYYRIAREEMREMEEQELA